MKCVNRIYLDGRRTHLFFLYEEVTEVSHWPAKLCGMYAILLHGVAQGSIQSLMISVYKRLLGGMVRLFGLSCHLFYLSFLIMQFVIFQCLAETRSDMTHLWLTLSPDKNQM